MIRAVATLILLTTAMLPARADVSVATERGLSLCPAGCFDVELIELEDRRDARAFIDGPGNPSATREEGITVVVRGPWDPDAGGYGPSQTYRGSLDPPGGLLAWSPSSGGGYYRGTVTAEDGSTCDLVLDWWAFDGAAPVSYEAGAGVAVSRAGQWPIGFYASSEACGLGGSSYEGPRGVAWQTAAASAGA